MLVPEKLPRGGVARLSTAGGNPQAAVVLSTLVIGALFVPVRARVQQVMDWRFYRRTHDAARSLAAFAAQARDETNLNQLSGRLTSVVQAAKQPAHVSLWRRQAGRAERPPR